MERWLRFRVTFRFKATGEKTMARIKGLWGGKTMPEKWKWFKDIEVERLDERLVQKLEAARIILGKPIVITSGWRDPKKNKSAGGVNNSAHERGLAVDVRTRTKEYQNKLVKAFRQVGFIRIGVYDKHVHADIDASKPQVAWAGGQSHA